MSLSSLYLDAFLGVAKTENFSVAAKDLNITQSALSQRVKNLEDDLGLTLFLRTPRGATLTEQGQKLLRYCKMKDSLEQELLNDLTLNKTHELSGTIRIATYSSVLRSAIIPSLTPLLKNTPHILCEFICAQVEELPAMLHRGEVDLIILDYQLEKASLEVETLGKESFVVIEGKKDLNRNDIFLDNAPHDRATENFLKQQARKAPKYRRSYFDDCYGIIDAVSQGLGRAVMSAHLIKKNQNIRVVKGFKSFKLEVCLHYHKQPFYSKLHQTVVNELHRNTKKFLEV